MVVPKYSIQKLIIFTAVITIPWLLTACSALPSDLDPTPTWNVTRELTAIPRRIDDTMTPPPTVITPTENTCTEDIIFTRDDVRWVHWDTYLKKYVYEVEGNVNYWTYSTEDRKEIQQDIPYEQYQKDIVAQFGIVGARFSRLSPDGTKMIYSQSISIGPTLEPTPDSGGEVAVDLVSKIYLKYLDHTENFLGEFGGVVDNFEWSSDSTKIVITMSRDLSFDMERGLLYLLDLDDMSMDTLLSYPMVDYQDFGFVGFSNDDHWMLFGGEKNFLLNIHDGTKKSIQLPKNALRDYWGYDSSYLLVLIEEGWSKPFVYTSSSFYWSDVDTGQLIATSINKHKINLSHGSAIAPSADFKYLAIIDFNDRLSIIKIKSCNESTIPWMGSY